MAMNVAIQIGNHCATAFRHPLNWPGTVVLDLWREKKIKTVNLERDLCLNYFFAMLAGYTEIVVGPLIRPSSPFVLLMWESIVND